MSKTRTSNYDNFQSMYPSSINSRAYIEENGREKTAATYNSSSLSSLSALGLSAGLATGGLNILRNSSRRFYDPEITTTAIYLPRSIKQKNRWRRWFYDHDEIVGAVLDLHAELPYSRAEVICEDKKIKQQVEDCLDETQFFSMLPLIDLEYLKIGEVFINTPWDSTKGMWKDIIIHNPDFVELSASPFADQQYSVELIPDDELKHLVNSTKPQDQELKKRLPHEIIKRVLSGKNLVLDPDEITHIARRSNPYDLRGTSILDRLFRSLMYEDKLRESQITIADNFIYPLKIFKLGDPQKGWIPNADHQMALAQMLQQATFDPNFALIYHYALSVDYVTVADKVMKLDREWDEIAKKKMIALGVSQNFMTGESTYASANVGLQTQLARYKAKRDLFEVRWIQNKFFKGLAKRNEWYRRDKREITGQFRVGRSEEEKEERLIMPKLVWHKKLMLRDDQAFLTFMNNVYAQGKGPLSALTLLQSMGLDLEDELIRKKQQKQLEERIGIYIQPPASGGMMPPPLAGISHKFKNFRDKFGSKKEEQQEREVINLDSQNIEFIGENKKAIDVEETLVNSDRVARQEARIELSTFNYIDPVKEETWDLNLKCDAIPGPAKMLFYKISDYTTKNKQADEFIDVFSKLYMQGKLFSYEKTGFVSYSENSELKSFNDLLISEEIEGWTKQSFTSRAAEDSSTNFCSKMKNLGLTAFCFGQLKGYNEQGIYNVKVENIRMKDGQVFPTTELLSRGRNLAFLLSPNLEVCLFSPATEGCDEEFGNKIDPQVKRYRNFYIDDIRVGSCPVDIIDPTKRLVSKISKFYKKSKFSRVEFVPDIIDLPEWEEIQKQKISKELFSLEDKDEKATQLRDMLTSAKLQQEKIKHRGYVPFFFHKDILYASNWIAQENESLSNIFIRNSDFPSEDIEKQIRKAFKTPNLDLSPDELDTYKMYQFIDPIYDSKENHIGYEVNDSRLKYSEVDSKLLKGKVWDSQGKCLNKESSDQIQKFKENFTNWINYPQFLDKDLEESFANLGV